MGRLYLLLAVIAGAGISWTVYSNSLLATHTTDIMGSMMVHGIGTFFALSFFLYYFYRQRNHKAAPLPLWNYGGGILGGLIVLLFSKTANSYLGISGAICLGLVGQTTFALAVDGFGLFGSPRRRLSGLDLLQASLVLSGSLLLVWSQNSRMTAP